MDQRSTSFKEFLVVPPPQFVHGHAPKLGITLSEVRRFLNLLQFGGVLRVQFLFSHDEYRSCNTDSVSDRPHIDGRTIHRTA